MEFTYQFMNKKRIFTQKQNPMPLIGIITSLENNKNNPNNNNHNFDHHIKISQCKTHIHSSLGLWDEKKKPCKTKVNTSYKGSNMFLLTYGYDTNCKETWTSPFLIL